MPVYTITATCAGETATATVTIPDLTGTLDVTQVADLDVSAAIAGLSDDTTVTIDWGDGTTPETGVALTGGAATATHTYGDQSGSPYTVTVTGDDTGAVLTDTVAVTNPQMALALDDTGDPTITATVTKIAGSNATIALDWGDDTEQDTATVTDGTATGSHTYAVNGDYTVQALAAATSSSASQTVTIAGGTPPALPAPTGLALDASADPPTESSFSVQWAAVAGATGYTATATGGSQTDWPGTVDASGDPVKASFASLEADTEYTVSVIANGDGTTSSDSAAATLTVSTTAAA